MLDLAKPMLVKLGRDRVQRSDIAKELKKSSQYVGRVLVALAEKGLVGLVSSKKEGRDRNYTPSLDAIMAYSEIA